MRKCRGTRTEGIARAAMHGCLERSGGVRRWRRGEKPRRCVWLIVCVLKGRARAEPDLNFELVRGMAGNEVEIMGGGRQGKGVAGKEPTKFKH